MFPAVNPPYAVNRPRIYDRCLPPFCGYSSIPLDTHMYFFSHEDRQARTSRGLQVARKPPFRQKKKKKKKVAALRPRPLRSLAPKALHAFESRKKLRVADSRTTAAATCRSTLGAWNWGVVPRYPPCPHKRFRRVSWQIAQTGQFSAANLVSLRS